MMRTEDLERLERAIEDDRRKRIREVEEAFDKKREALGIARALFEEYGAAPIPTETERAEGPVAEEDDGLLPDMAETDGEEVVAAPDPPDAGGSVEEEQRTDGGESVTDPFDRVVIVQVDADRNEQAPEQEDAEEPEEVRRICRECEETKALSEFDRNKNSLDGYSKLCRDCKSAKSRAAAQAKYANPEAQDEAPESKPCKDCGDTKPLDAFPKNHTYKDGHTNRCKACTNASRKTSPQGPTEPREEASEGPAGDPDPEPAPEPAPEPPAAREARTVANSVTKLPRATRAPEPKSPAPPPHKKARYCRNGKNCVSYPHTGEPTKLTSGNKSSVCYSCEEKVTAFGSRPVGTLGPLVRKSNADKEGVG